MPEMMTFKEAAAVTTRTLLYDAMLHKLNVGTYGDHELVSSIPSVPADTLYLNSIAERTFTGWDTGDDSSESTLIRIGRLEEAVDHVSQFSDNDSGKAVDPETYFRRVWERIAGETTVPA